MMVAVAIGLAVAVALSMALAGDAQAKKKKPKPVDLQSTVAESGYNDTFNGVGDTAPINGSPFTYNAKKKFTSLTRVNIWLTMADGDTQPGQSDFNQLTLGLDGFDTGILLNGFDGDGVTTLIVGDAPKNESKIIAALNKRP
jgi:hypothetical protein